jgi:tRNA (cytidine/uridine-2'-O-)-methyltransferase
MVSLALYQPDIPQNTGAALRLCACLDVALHVIAPAGFDFSDRALRRAGMDYVALATLLRHRSWEDFEAWRKESGYRLILNTTRAGQPYTSFPFAADDILLFGRESVGAPDAVHAAADAHIRIPMRQGLRSLNLTTAAAMVLGEALRQTDRFPPAARDAESGADA